MAVSFLTPFFLPIFSFFAASSGQDPAEVAVAALSAGVFRRVVAGIAQSGVAGYVDRQPVRSGIKEEGERRRAVHVQVCVWGGGEGLGMWIANL